jgi:hypothetical protein
MLIKTLSMFIAEKKVLKISKDHRLIWEMFLLLNFNLYIIVYHLLPFVLTSTTQDWTTDSPSLSLSAAQSRLCLDHHSRHQTFMWFNQNNTFNHWNSASDSCGVIQIPVSSELPSPYPSLCYLRRSGAIPLICQPSQSAVQLWWHP